MRSRKNSSTQWKSAAITIIAITVLYGTVSLYIQWLDTSEALAIRKMEFQGNDLLSNKELNLLTGVDQLSHMAEVSLTTIDSCLRSNPFIEHVSVTRTYPGTIIMEIVEKQPVALLRVDENLYAIDKEGTILKSRPGRMYNLPIISGDFQGGVSIGKRAENALLTEGLSFINLILAERPELYTAISEVVTGCREKLLVYTDKGGIPVKFGTEQLKYKIQCLEAILDRMDQENSFNKVKYIDLRYDKQVILGMRI